MDPSATTRQVRLTISCAVHVDEAHGDPEAFQFEKRHGDAAAISGGLGRLGRKPTRDMTRSELKDEILALRLSPPVHGWGAPAASSRPSSTARGTRSRRWRRRARKKNTTRGTRWHYCNNSPLAKGEKIIHIFVVRKYKKFHTLFLNFSMPFDDKLMVFLFDNKLIHHHQNHKTTTTTTTTAAAVLRVTRFHNCRWTRSGYCCVGWT